MELTYIKTTAGKMYSALCANACTITTEDGVLIKEIEANKQDYFIAPNAKIVSTDASLILTECFNSAPFGLAADWGENLNADSETDEEAETNMALLEQVTEDVAELNASMQAIDERLSASESLNSSQDSSISELQSLCTEQTTLISNLQASLATTKSLPDWTNAVALAFSDFPYTAPANGWVVGYASGDGDAGFLLRVNDVSISIDCGSGDLMLVQQLVAEGDILSISATLSAINMKFIPLKD